MATTTIPWNDGSGDNITLTYTSASGSQTVSVSSDANTGAARSKTITFTSGVGSITRQLTVNQEAGTPSYELAEYIETAGAAWLNTGIALSSVNYEMEIKMQWTGSTVSQFESFFAYYTTSRSGLHKYMSKWMKGTNSTIVSSTVADNNVHVFTLSANTSDYSEVLTMDGAVINSASRGGALSFSSNTPFYLGGRNRGSSVDNPCKAKFWYLKFKIFSDASHTTLANEWNFIPVKMNGVFGMYDTISKTFVSSISGTDFTGQLKN